MSTLTKTFIILNLIFSVAFVMVSATVLSQQDDWKKKHAAQQERNSEEVARLTKAKNKFEADNVTLAAELEKSRTLLGNAERTLNDRIVEIKAANATIDELKRRGGILDARLEVLGQNVNRLASDLADAQKSLSVAKDELKDTKSQLGVRNITVVGLQAQIAALTLQHEQTLYEYALVKAEKDYFKEVVDVAKRNGGVLQPDQGGGKRVEAPVIRATVRLVDPKMGIVVLGVGSKSDVPVKKGYHFLIYHDRTYVASVRVSNVDESMCAAQVIAPKTDLAIQIGDSAITKQN